MTFLNVHTIYTEFRYIRKKSRKRNKEIKKII